MNRADLQRRYSAVRGRMEALAEPLTDEDCQLQSMPDASPAKWHLAHTTWFFETLVLVPHVPGYEAYDPRWGYLFNSYYEALGPRHARPARGVLSRPTRREVMKYRSAIDEHILTLIGQASDEVRALVELGLHHEEQHQELLLSDIQHAFAQNALTPIYRAAPAEPRRAAPTRHWHGHAGGLATIGHRGPGFGFDNETPVHSVYLEPFELATWLVTNRDYQEFMADGGYERAELWLSDGLETMRREAWQSPLYWRREGDHWCRYSLHGLIPLEPDAPVTHVSFYEADAYARWAGARLPREAEWEVVAQTLKASAPQLGDSGWLLPEQSENLLGGAWVWTASAYSPYPGFQPAAGAVGEYNGKFMCNQLVLRGGSCFTPPGHIRASYRNFFYPNARWQVSGIRLARDVQRRAR